ncbi:hypothetical protein WOLCODRAFT_161344 [Wolfiporia cocos MD-104 SS10]|uniref:Uncharacterized protein n=1 Tax=Wolfiporia cocos (strain MD-104) TaxID=742152 RepID=A0A2H3J7D8_WOLCO|nr:hypothetical protein WOLCODRAFT_161344 [Wolfiporia cocos MD-104 SS10]
MFSPDADSQNPAFASMHGAPSPLPSLALTRAQITEALSKSSDNGTTLDLAHRRLTEVGEEAAEELAALGQETEDGCTVVRIALAYNRLTTLPTTFAFLLRLRYLVLRNNNFTEFPDVLTKIPSLEILDLSRNKVKRLPAEPGSLVNLRVLSVLRNKISRLPPYISQFHQLAILKVDQNPIEWPPKSVLGSTKDLDDPQIMGEWIKRVKSWIEDNTNPLRERKVSEVSIRSEPFPSEPSDATIGLSGTPQSSPPHDGPHAHGTALHHTRSFSLESDSSTYFQLDRSQRKVERSRSPLAQPVWPSRLQFESTSAVSNDVSPSHSPDSYYPPDEISSTKDEDGSSVLENPFARSPSDATTSEGQQRISTSSTITVKKNMPDLRPLKLQVSTSREGSDFPQRSYTHTGQSSQPSGLGSLRYRHSVSIEATSVSPVSSITADRPAPSMDKERHSYFRRSSTLAVLNLAKAIPEELLALIDAVRGILFAVSQIYQTLQLYTEYAIDERLSAVLMKVLDPASAYMSQLINALDRFDSMSKRTLPTPSVCRAVVESCRDNVTVFGKAVGVLALQLKVLATHDDVRYTRQMLLTLYGAMTEIAGSWQSMATLIEAVKPLLWEVRPPVTKTFTGQGQTIRTAGAPGNEPARSPVSAPANGSSTFTSALDQPRLRPNVSPGSLDHGKRRMARRHAGSFSLKDVEIGKLLPSYVEPLPPLTAGVFNGVSPSTPVPRTMRRVGLPPGSASLHSTQTTHPTGTHGPETPSPSTSGPYARSWDAHSRKGSQSSLNHSSSSTSLAPRVAQPDTPTSTSALVDREAIDAMKQALDAAPAIWEMMGEILDETQEPKDDLKGTLRKAQDVAERLRRNIESIQDGDPVLDRKPLHDDARTFAKTVIQLSNAIRVHGTAHPLSSTVKMNMVKLTNATEEFVILLHVSSFSPAPIPRPYSPMVALPSPLGLPGDDGRLGTSLSRSRTAIPLTNSKLGPTVRDPPYSALPHQTFAIPTPPRFGPLRKEMAGQPTAVPA